MVCPRFSPAGAGEVIEVFCPPVGHDIALMLATGRGIKEPRPRAGQLALDALLVENRFD